jgi:hypothetical protein
MAATYDDVKNAMAAGTPPELICATCPWDRLCVQPPTMTRAEIDRLVSDAEAKDKARDPNAMPAGMLVTALTFAGKDTSGQLCPVFSLRLKSDRGVADTIRSAMKTYGEVTSQ